MRHFRCGSVDASRSGLGMISEELSPDLAVRLLGWELPIRFTFKDAHSGDPIILNGRAARIHFDMSGPSAESRQARLGIALDESEKSRWKPYQDFIQRFETT